MDYLAVLEEILAQLDTDDIPDEYIARIEFSMNGQDFHVDADCVGEWKEGRPRNAKNVKVYLNTARLEARLRLEHLYVMSRVEIMGIEA